jgi:hypothetical protein
MRLEVLTQEAGELLQDAAAADATPVLQVRQGFGLGFGRVWGMHHTAAPAHACGGVSLTSAAGRVLLAVQVSLHRADALTAVLELDAHLRVTRADGAAGLLFGSAAKALQGQAVPK